MTDTLYRDPTTGQLIFKNAASSQYLSNVPSPKLTTHDDTSFSWDNQESRTTSTTNGYLSLKCPTADNSNFGARYKSKTGTYTITVLINQVSFTGQAFGIGWRESSSGKIIIFGNSFSGGLRVIKQNTTTSYNSDYSSTGLLNTSWYMTRDYYWMQIQDDGTNRYCRLSSNGFDWCNIHSVGNTDFITADQVLYTNVSDGKTESYFNILSWTESA